MGLYSNPRFEVHATHHGADSLQRTFSDLENAVHWADHVLARRWQTIQSKKETKENWEDLAANMIERLEYQVVEVHLGHVGDFHARLTRTRHTADLKPEDQKEVD